MALPSVPPEQYDELEMAQTFLVVHQHLQALGHPAISEPFSHASPRLSNDDELLSSRAVNLLRILHAAHAYTALDDPKHLHAPWHSESTFQRLWRTLESLRLQNPDDVELDISLFEEVNLPSNMLSIALLSSLAWHCAVLVLHRQFLAYSSSWASGTAVTTRADTFSTQSSCFLKEHVRVGLSSAFAVVNICAQIMQVESFVFVGIPGVL